ncbi:hypothetical protein O6P43_001772 [Quillaja saponaria]|uniref:Uncharacterized protein n=1 Tax=Quillaja saponaria TaxID=32244 RepID=A0AAD7VP41_QUISA|nr:hypothetical protein O6P43_001772 [Quillaja saponaria]
MSHGWRLWVLEGCWNLIRQSCKKGEVGCLGQHKGKGCNCTFNAFSTQANTDENKEGTARFKEKKRLLKVNSSHTPTKIKGISRYYTNGAENREEQLTITSTASKICEAKTLK